MNKKLKTITVSLLIGVAGMSACDRYLDVKSNSALVTPNTIESLQRLLDASRDMNFSVNAYAEASADDYFLTDDTYNARPESNRNVYTWRNFDDTWNNDWARGYLAVYNANLALSQLGGIERTEVNASEWDRVYGGAHFFRAHQFLSLVWTYAKAYDPITADSEFGIVLRLDADPTVPSKRASLADSYRQIINDLKVSIDFLPLRSEHAMRPSGLAAYGMLARAYLSMGKFDSAYVYADRALTSYSALMDFNDPGQVNLSATFPFQRLNSETIFYAELASSQPTIHPNYAHIDSTLYRSYEDGDLRKLAYFSTTDGYASFKGSYAQGTDGFAGLATDELYLIRAECAARLGRREQALSDLNALLETRWRNGAFRAFTAESDDETLSLILAERRKELLMRGLRWIDVKRLNVQAASISLKRFVNDELIELSPNDNRFALPIPVDIIAATGMPQNEY
ncbi:RagB/SusD family nutrient uptake outer membrane protein [Parapedobacter soli]|uniref:RagB/SusD family nutrient uptake outer membrane protein n=1 Tax=Parapedobacter soli TaxID=416955 RepID=UPI0021C71329|nr:RagB/SusD family nutrient uptake outer membrane protein [Parapedobacter soli]